MIKQIAEHRSHRKFATTPIPDTAMRRMLEAAIRASNTGNMQAYSIIVTTEPQLLAKLRPCHFNQPAAHAPAIITFCADIRRFSRWCRLRGATPEYDNFLWFTSAMTDALLASQNLALQAEAENLGICYLGTALYNAPEIAEIIDLPDGVIPVMALSCGYPATDPTSPDYPPLTDRLPLEAVVHDQKYHDPTDAQIEKHWAAREASQQTATLLQENDLPNLARIFTERRYRGEDNRTFSRKYFDELVKKGFFNQ